MVSVNIHYLLVFKRYTRGKLDLPNKNDLPNKLSGMNRETIAVGKTSFLNNAGLFLGAREKILNNFKSKLCPIKNLDKTPTLDPIEKK